MEYLLPLAVSDGTFKHRFAAAMEWGQDRLSFSDLKVCSPKDPAPALKQSVKYALNIPRYAGGSLLAGSV